MSTTDDLLKETMNRNKDEAGIPKINWDFFKLLLDNNDLTKMDGFEVLKQLKSDPAYSSIPVVMLTTSSRDEEIARGYAEGANSYVTKPIKFNEFAEKVKSIGLYWGLIASLP